jgi:4-amino-4-deoxy-L-arabinose transferase-like glycosyltransferase
MLRAAAGRTLAATRRVPVPLALLLACALVLGTSWSLVTAPLQSFDEDDHVAYALYLAQTGTPPSADGGSERYGRAEQRALQGLALRRMTQNPAVRPPWRAADERAFERFEATLPDDGTELGSGPNPLAKNPPLFYAYEAAVSRIVPGGFFADLWAMRLANVLVLLAAVCFAWLLAAELFVRTLPRVVAAGVVALQPVLGQLAGIVNSDTLLTAAYLALTWLGVRACRRGLTIGRLAAIGAAAGACVLTHGRGIAAIPAFVLIGLVLAVRHRPTLKAALRPALAGVLTLAAAVVAYRLYTAASSGGSGGGALYGGEVSFAPKGANPREFLSYVWQFYFPALETMAPRIGPDYGFHQVYVQTLFGSFGSYEVYLAKGVLDTIGLTLVGGALALVAVLVRRWEQARRQWAEIVLVIAPAACLVGLLHLASYRSLLGTPDPLITGRYFLPLLGVIGIGAAVLVDTLPRRAGAVLAGALLTGLALTSLSGIALTLARSYV